MPLTADEQKLLDELTAKASQADADDEFEIEIFSGDKGARIPFSQGKDWLFREFGIGQAPAAPATAGGDGGDTGNGGKPAPVRRSYFAGKQQQKPGGGNG